MEKKNISINEYSLKIKGIIESLASINVSVDDDDSISIRLNGLGKEHKSFKTSVTVRENVPNFRKFCVNADCRRENLK